MSSDKTIGQTPRVDAPRRKGPVAPVAPAAPRPGVPGDRLRVTGQLPAADPLTQVTGRSNGDFLADPDATTKMDARTERLKRVAELRAAVEAQAASKADAIAAAQKQAGSGNVAARAFNSFVNVFNKNQTEMQQAADHAVRLYKSELPADLGRYSDLIAAAGEDPAKLAAADEFLRGAMTRAEQAGRAFDKTQADFKQGSKFWSGITADVTAGLMVLGGAALCITGFGAPIGAGLIAGGFVAGGAATVGMHALLDSQYDFKKEALGNFLVGGISSGATVLTAGAGAGVTASLGRLAVRQGTIGATTGLAGAAANEASGGWQDGWALRLFTSTAIGAGTGAALGAGSGAIASKLIPQNLSATAQRAVSVGLGSATGATGAGAGAVINEGIGGFQEGWLDRVVQQALGGGLSGLAYAFGPDLAARNQALLAKRAAFDASPKGQAVKTLRTNFEDLDALKLKPGILGEGVEAVSPKTRKALEAALESRHGSVDAAGAANVDHLASVFGGVLERAHRQNGGKPLTQRQVDRLAMETVLTDAFAKGNTAQNLEDFRTAPTNAGDTAGEIFAHLKAEAKKAIGAPAGTPLEKVIHDRIDQGKLNPGIVADPEFQAALKAANYTEGQTRALMTRINKNFLNVTPAMLGTWVHGVPSYDQIAQVVLKGGGTRVDAQQVYEAVLGHHMSGFIANGFARGNLELDFPGMVRQGHLSPDAATRLGNLYSSATGLAEKWRPIVDKITAKGQTVTGPNGEKTTIYTLTPKQRAAYEKAAEPYKQAIADLPEAVRSQLLNDDQRQFTAQGMPKWLGMMEGMKKPATNGQLLDIVYREPLQAYLLENVARGSHDAFIDYSAGAARKLGMAYDPATMAFKPSADPTVRADLARRIQAEPGTGQALQTAVAAGSLPANPTPAQVVDWFMAQPTSSAAINRVLNTP